MHFGAASLALTSALLLPFCALAIFSDEAYTNDYHHALLGVPQPDTTFFHRPSAASKASLLYTLSEKLVLGAINPKDGSIVWRQRLGVADNHTGNGYLKAGEDGTVISAVGGEVQAWNAGDGRLAWGWKSAGNIRGLEVLEGQEQKGVLAFSQEEGSRTVLRKLAADTGDIVWEHTDVSGDQAFGISSSLDNVYTISLHMALLKGYKIKVTEFNKGTGRQGSQHTLSSDGEVTSEDSILFLGSKTHSPLLVWTDKAFKVFKVNILGSKHISTVTVAQGDDAIDSMHVHAPAAADAPAHFLVHYQTASSHWAEVYHVDPSTGAATKAYSLLKVGGRGAFSSSTEGSKVYYTRHTDFEMSLVSSNSKEILSAWPIRPKSHGGLVDPQGVLHATSEVLSKGPSNFAVRSALTLSSGDWELVRNGDPVWIRPESLAGAVAAAWVDSKAEDGLADELAAEAEGGLVGAYIHRLRRHAREFVSYFPEWIEGFPSLIMEAFSGKELRSAGAPTQRNSFGLDKIIVIATERGRVMALQSGNQGKVLWNIQAVDLQKHQQWDVLGIEIAEGCALIRAPDGEFIRLSVSDGKILSYQPGGLISALKTSVSTLDVSGRTLRIPVDRDGSIKEVPQNKLANGTIVVTQGEDGVVRGWAIPQAARLYAAWSFFPGPDEEVSGIASSSASDPIASIGKALGDRNVLYKYLNPNLLAITTIDRVASRASIYLLDSASGETIYSSNHFGVDVSQSIILTLSENWIAYSLYLDPLKDNAEASSKAPTLPKGHQLIVSELFESSLPNDRGPLGQSSNYSTIHPLTASDDSTTSTPYVISQAYLLPGPISKITTTSTLQSITPRSLICILPNLNALISIPRSVADPRRPVGRDPTSAEIEEGLFRHNAQIDFEPKWILTHKREVMGLTDVITAPTLLESTSLVFAYGELDFFGTRVAPIGEFDVLGKGFSRFQLMATVVGLAVLTGGLAPMIRKKQIDALWTS